MRQTAAHTWTSSSKAQAWALDAPILAACFAMATALVMLPRASTKPTSRARFPDHTRPCSSQHEVVLQSVEVLLHYSDMSQEQCTLPGFLLCKGKHVL